jgi:pimeloyl-ACP methyl ester carboxylesterase
MLESIRPGGRSCVPLFLALGFAALAAAQERVALSPKDGHPCVATLVKPAGTPKGGVVALPAAKSARVAFDPLLPRLASAGLMAIAIDPRAEGTPVEAAGSRPADDGGARLDLEAALEYLVQHGAPVDKLAIVASGSGTSVALAFAAKTGRRVKALALLSPGRDEPIPAKELFAEISPRPVLVVATEDEAAKGAQPLKELLAGVELNLLPDRLASGTTMFGRVTGIESTIADWLDRMLAQPSAIDIPESKLVFIDGEIMAEEARDATVLKVPLGDGGAATIRLSQARKRLLLGFDVPEPYVRLNEVVIYVDSSGQGGRIIDKNCWRISYNPRNPARKPLWVQRGGIKGFEDSDEKGVVAFARTEEKRRWTAEVSLDFSRFLPGEGPRPIRLGFQVNGQRVSDVRYFPDDAKLPTTPGSWAVANLK